MEKRLLKWVGCNEVVGIEAVDVTSDVRFYAVHLKRKKGEILIERKWESNCLEDLISSVKEIPMVMTLTGEGTVSMSRPFEDESSLVQYNTRLDNVEIHTSVREDQLSRMTESLQKEGAKLFNLIAGPYWLVSIADWMKEDVITLNRYSIDLNEQGWNTNADGIDREFDIHGELLSSNYLLAFAGAVEALLSFPEIPNGRQSNIVELAYNRAVKKIAVPVLIALLIAVLVVSGGQLFLQSANEELNTKLSMHSGMLQQLDSLQNSVDRQEMFFQKGGWLTSSNVAFYVDQIGSVTDENITLDLVHVFPSENKKDNASIEERSNRIRVNGRTRNGLVFAEWRNELDKLTWVDEVIVISYDGSEEDVFLIDVIVRSHG